MAVGGAGNVILFTGTFVSRAHTFAFAVLCDTRVHMEHINELKHLL